MSLGLRFWGVRGSIPAPEPRNLGYGGNTSCIEVLCNGETGLILDAGTGIRRLGLDLASGKRTSGCSIHVCLTHFHWDHIQGLPFLTPLYQPGWEINLCGVRPPEVLESLLHGQMADPYFGAESAVQAECRYLEVGVDGLELGPLLVRSFPLHHPGGAYGYRVDAFGHTIVYASDHEHGESDIQAALLRRCNGADVLIYDAQYTPEEYLRHRGWGHSTWLEGVRLAREAGAKKLILFHHDPEHDDVTISRIESDASAEFPGAIAAKEGLTIDL